MKQEEPKETKTCENNHTMTGIGFDDFCPECEAKWQEPKEISGWEAQLKDYMVDLIDEYFPKDNQDHPERQSTTHRSEAMASHALFLVKAREIIQKVISQAKETIREFDKKYNQLAEEKVRESRSETLKEIAQMFDDEMAEVRAGGTLTPTGETIMKVLEEIKQTILTRIQELKKG